MFWGTSLLATLTNAPYLFQWTNLPPGNYTLTAQVVDSAGLIGVSAPVSFAVTRPPSLTIQSPTNGATFAQPNPIPVAVDAYDPTGPVKEVDLFWGTSLLATLTNAPYLFQWTNLPPGNYTLTAQDVNSAGLIRVSAPVCFVVTPPLPSLTIQSPTNGATFTQPDPVAVAVDACVPDGYIEEVDLFCGTSLLATLTNAPYLFQWTNLPPGNYTLTAQAVDDADMIGVSSPVSFVVMRPPSAPIFAVQPADQNAYSGNDVAFCVRACGHRPVYYQWLFNSAPIDGATNTFLILNNVQMSDAGSYTVTAANPWGSVVSQPAILSVNLAPPLGGNANSPPLLDFSGLEVVDPALPLICVHAATIFNVVNIEWSSDCQVWNPLLTLTNNGGVLYFVDPDAANCPQRFYRAVAQQ